MPKISVLMPVYNTQEKFLREAIESILSQTFDDFEFLILDDGSTNDIANVVNSYEDKRIKYFYHQNIGIAATLNKGIELATGEFIARMDSDDISHLNRFAIQIKFLEDNPDISIVGCWMEQIPSKKIIQHPFIVNFLSLLKNCCIGHPTVMLRKADFVKHNLRYNEDFKSAQDYELWSRCIHILKIRNIQQVLLSLRVHNESISSKNSKQQNSNAEFVRHKMLDFLTNNKDMQKRILFDSATISIKLFNIIPFLRIKKKLNCERWFLFGFIPFFKIRTK